jgi:hypothetical protein
MVHDRASQLRMTKPMSLRSKIGPGEAASLQISSPENIFEFADRWCALRKTVLTLGLPYHITLIDHLCIEKGRPMDDPAESRPIDTSEDCKDDQRKIYSIRHLTSPHRKRRKRASRTTLCPFSRHFFRTEPIKRPTCIYHFVQVTRLIWSSDCD